jgi:hypothetical protein
MLGHFLEYAVPTHQLLDSLDFYTRLGFSVASDTGDARLGTIALSDGRLTVRLCGATGQPPTLVFVRPQLSELANALQDIGIDPEYVALGDHQFNRLECRLPGGLSVMVTEARTHSPVTPQPSVLGWFEEFEINGIGHDVNARAWETLGFVVFDHRDRLRPEIIVANDSLSLSMQPRADVSHTTLVFTADDLESVYESLGLQGISAEISLATTGNAPSEIRLRAPEGTVLAVRNVR